MKESMKEEKREKEKKVIEREGDESIFTFLMALMASLKDMPEKFNPFTPTKQSLTCRK